MMTGTAARQNRSPSSLRTLKIQRNYLSGLTAWGHLVNLQYLDVSGNDLESLDGFGSLIHLCTLSGELIVYIASKGH